ncbi:MAG TPA: NADH-quinone oxidoreductase subunit H, partial [bacterium]|nr:NADH-quinone oxidoreductase subunit H [bacterium]
MPETSVIILRILLPFTVMLALIPLLVWLERKGSAYIQDRPGPNRAAILGIRLGGLLHPLADVIKLAFKEDFIPSGANRFYYYLAPFLTFCVASVTFLVIPFGSPITFGTQIIHLQAASLNIGILYILAISSLGVYGIMLAGLASHNKFALLGGLRASAQMISYELSLGLAIISLVMTTGSLDLQEMVQQQSPLLWRWNFIRDPLAFLIVIVASFAEINRIPFDLPEGESELVAGYHVEYSSLKFAMFF